MAKKDSALTYQQAIDVWFGGVKALAAQSLPFTCRCGESTYNIPQGIDPPLTKPIMTIPDCFAHVRKVHKERIKKPKLDDNQKYFKDS